MILSQHTNTGSTHGQHHHQLVTLLENVQTRDEVASLLNEMLATVEVEQHVNLLYTYESQISELKHEVAVLTNEVDERRALSNMEAEERSELADKLVGELWALSVKLERMEEWEQKNRGKVENFDELQAELKRQEEKVRSLRRQASLSLNANRDPNEENGAPSTATEPTAANLSAAMTALIEEETSVGFSKRSASEEKNSSIANGCSTIVDGDVKNGVNIVEDIMEAGEEQTKPLSSTKQPDEANNLSGGDKEDSAKDVLPSSPPPGLKSLNEKNLLDIFSFLEAYDVLNCAQIDKEFYSRVDILFGIGSSVVNTSKPAKPIQSNNSNNKDMAQKKQTTEAKAPATKIQERSDQATSASSSPAKTVANNFLDIFAPGSSLSTSTSSSPQQQQRPQLLAYVSSMVQKQTQKVSASSPLSKMSNVESNTTGTLASLTQAQASSTSLEPAPVGGLTASMADSMADKLTASELAVIITMTEKLRQREKDIKRLTAEREDLAARLDGSEAVKDFLMVKVQKAEVALKKSTDEALLVSQQVSSDQEVIAFLDGNVQKLEKNGRDLAEKKKMLETILIQTREQNEKRVKVLEDMLQFERQQLTEQEKEYKSTKKVLVKEVKHCRAQIAALKAERDSFQQQNSQLKQALLKRNGTKIR